MPHLCDPCILQSTFFRTESEVLCNSSIFTEYDEQMYSACLVSNCKLFLECLLG